jgi:hypothetical protein
MIQLNCTKCKSLLQIDDAFAGGVCRCRHCGTIQTVPKRLKNSNGESATVAQAAVAASQAPVTAAQKKSTYEQGSGTGLDDLAGVVASSGLTSGRLRKAAKPAVKPKTAGSKDNRTRTIITVAGIVIGLLVGIIIFMAVHGNSGGGDTAQNGPAPTGNLGGHDTSNANLNSGNPVITPPSNTNNARGPAFLGQPISEKSVAYVLDRGNASSDEKRLDLLKAALLNSINSLGPGRKFAVIFWQVDGAKAEAFPSEGLREATPENVNELRKFLDDVYSLGQTRAPPATEIAFRSGAEAIVLVPIKTFIEDGTHTAIVQTRGNSTARVYCFTLAQPDIGAAFKKVASDTNGSYRDVSLDELRAAGQ